MDVASPQVAWVSVRSSKHANTPTHNAPVLPRPHASTLHQLVAQGLRTAPLHSTTTTALGGVCPARQSRGCRVCEVCLRLASPERQSVGPLQTGKDSPRPKAHSQNWQKKGGAREVAHERKGTLRR